MLKLVSFPQIPDSIKYYGTYLAHHNQPYQEITWAYTGCTKKSLQLGKSQ